ncbi:hypothetical protein ACLB2K_003995 [Fragaria x ananassa]
MEVGSMAKLQRPCLPYFHAVYDIRSDSAYMRIPKSFAHTHLQCDLSHTAWLTLKGVEGRSWKCEVVYNNEQCLIWKGWVKFFTDISHVHASINFIFEYAGNEMQFNVTRFDMEGNLITTAARKGLLEYPGCVDAQEAMEHQLLYHVWSNAWSPLVLPTRRFADGLKDIGVPRTYNLKLETHPTINWEVTVDFHRESLLKVSHGWKAFAIETEINVSTCVRLKLVNKNILCAIIFCTSNGEVIVPPFLSTASSSNYVYNNTHLALNVIETRSSHASPDEFWFALGGPYTAERLQVYLAFVCTLHDNHGVMMQHAYTI